MVLLLEDGSGVQPRGDFPFWLLGLFVFITWELRTSKPYLPTPRPVSYFTNFLCVPGTYPWQPPAALDPQLVFGRREFSLLHRGGPPVLGIIEEEVRDHRMDNLLALPRQTSYVYHSYKGLLGPPRNLFL